MNIEFVSDVQVELVDSMGSDQRVAQAARVSVKGRNEPEGGEVSGLINYLLSNRHGSPFEHGALTFFVEAPIFVFREFHRHRAGWSYNEVSGRYTQLKPRFYVPAADRKLVNVGTSARPEFGPGSPQQVRDVSETLRISLEEAWSNYDYLLGQGVANEVARAVLPVATMSQMYATCNPRSLMNFLSLRVDSPDSVVRSRPQWEIQLVAERLEEYFARLFPITHAAFVKSGRVAP